MARLSGCMLLRAGVDSKNMAETETKRLFARALKAGAGRDYASAEALLCAALARGDAPADAVLYLGRARFALGQRGRAIEAFRLYLRRGGDRAAGCFFLGRAYLACGRNEAAITCFRRSAEAEPRRSTTWALLGAALLKLRRSKAAVACLERALTLSPEDQRINRGYLNALFVRGTRLLLRGDADMARQILGFVIENGLDGTAPRLWRAKAYRELGRVPEAMADCAEASKFSPGDPSIRWLMAGLLMAGGRSSEAIAEYEALKALWPDLPKQPVDDRGMARLRASVAFRSGEWKKAAAQALALLRTDPADAPLRAIAAESLRALGEYERSRNHWLRAVELDRRSPELWLGLALASWDLGDFPEALRASERARSLGADPEEADYYAALCRARLGEAPAKLIPTLQSLVKRRMIATGEPDPRLMFALAELYYKSGRADLAAGWFEKVLVLVPDHELSLLYRISVAESLSDQAAIQAAYSAYLDRYPDNSKIRREFVNLLVSGQGWEEAARQLELDMPYAAPGEKARRLLAVCYRNSGRYRDAALLYRELILDEPASPELLLGLAYCLERQGMGDFALALIEKAPQSAKTSSELWRLRGAIEARSGRTEAALDSLRKAAELAPADPRPWRDLRLLYTRQGLVDFAASCAEREAMLAGSSNGARSGAVDSLGRDGRGRSGPGRG